jgi:hypothetical protein
MGAKKVKIKGICFYISTYMRTKDKVQDRQPLLVATPDAVKKNRPETDQRIYSENKPVNTEEPVQRNLPLFSETLFKAKNFDPL